MRDLGSVSILVGLPLFGRRAGSRSSPYLFARRGGVDRPNTRQMRLSNLK